MSTRAAAGWLLLSVLLGAGTASAGTLRGEVRAPIEGIDAASIGPVVVFLEGRDAPIAVPERAAGRERRERIRQQDARFEPDFLAVVAGTLVEMPNLDLIFHNVFSYSTPNDFDLGTYPGGSSRDVRLRYPGVVRVYCSIHESMNATIFVAPSPYFAVTRLGDTFEIPDVPEGHYRLRAWALRLPSATAEVDVRGEGLVTIGLTLGSERTRGGAGHGGD